MKNQILKRIITAIIFGSLIIFSIIIEQLVFALLIYCALIVAFIEFKAIENSIIPPAKLSLSLILGTFFYWLIFALMYFDFNNKYFNFSNNIILFISLFWLLFLSYACFTVFSKSKDILNHLKNPFFPVLYIAFSLSTLNNFNSIRDIPAVLFFFIIIWIYDIFAYFSGMLLGKHKLCEHLSPKKTWEGLIGGTIITIMVFVVWGIIIKDIYFMRGLIGILIIIAFGTVGDLFESFLKRSAKIKDSGDLLPGHGGVLDRFDSTFFAAPMFYLYCVIIDYKI